MQNSAKHGPSHIPRDLPFTRSYVLAVASASSALVTAHIMKVVKLRKAARVPYPNEYATAVEAASSPEKYLFNCAQRAHQNFNEHYPLFLASIAIGGLQYPEIAAGLGALWLTARAFFLVGYTRANNNENGAGRRLGGWNLYVMMALMGLSAWSSVKMVTGL